MKLPLSLALAAVLTGGSLLPTVAEAAPKSSHREADFRVSSSKHHHHHDHERRYRVVKVWVKGHTVWRHGHRHWIPAHFEYRRIYF